MATTWVSFKQIKTDVAIEQVLTYYGVHVRRIGATDLRGRCPLPTHSSARSRDSFSVNVVRNVWSCRSESCMQGRGGKPGGNVLDFVALMESCSLREAALRLQNWSGSLPPRRPIITQPSVSGSNAPLRFTLQHVDGHHPYVTARGLTPDTMGRFGVGCYSGRGFLRGRIVIPIHDEHGELIAYVGRAVGHEEPKYRFPAGFKKSRVLFNLHRARATGARDVIVVEGFFDTFAAHQAGYPTVVALMGSTLSRDQADLLGTHFDRVLLMLDGDAAGRHGAAAIVQTLAGRMPVTAIPLEDGRQPDQLSPGEIQQILRREGLEPTTGIGRPEDTHVR